MITTVKFVASLWALGKVSVRGSSGIPKKNIIPCSTELNKIWLRHVQFKRPITYKAHKL